MTRATSVSVMDVQNLLGVSERHNQWMVSPLLLVVHADPFLALAGCFHHRAVSLDDRTFEELCGLLFPDLESSLVEGLHEHQDLHLIKSSTEITCRSRIGDALCSERVEVSFVSAPDLEMIQAGTTGKKIQSDVEDVVRFIVGRMHFEYGNAAVDESAQVERLNHLHDRTQAPSGDGLGSIRELQVEGRRVDDWRGRDVPFIDAIEKSALALLQPFSYVGVHSKPSIGCG